MNTTKIKGFLTAVLFVGLLSALAPRAAHAISLTELQVAELNKVRAADRVAHNNSKCANLAYVGSSTEAVVTILPQAITAYAPAGTADSSNFGVSLSSYVFTSTYDTMGELCDAIDDLADYKCTLLGCNRADVSARLREQTATSGTNDLKAAGGFDVLLDTGSNQGNQLTDVYDIAIGINPGSGKRVMIKTLTANINVDGTVLVYGKLKKFEGSDDGVTRNDTTLVWSAATADDTSLQVPVTLTETGWLEFAKDAHVVVQGGNGTGVQAAANFLEVQWDER